MVGGNVEKLLWKMEDHSWGTVNGDKCFRLSKAISRHCALRDHIYTHMFCNKFVILKILKGPRISLCKKKKKLPPNQSHFQNNTYHQRVSIIAQISHYQQHQQCCTFFKLTYFLAWRTQNFGRFWPFCREYTYFLAYFVYFFFYFLQAQIMCTFPG